MTDQTQPGAEATDETDPTDEGDARVMGLLSEHVPLSLLVDLADPQGPASDEILQSEGRPEDAWWVQEGADGAEGAEPDQDAAGAASSADSQDDAAPSGEAPSERTERP